MADIRKNNSKTPEKSPKPPESTPRCVYFRKKWGFADRGFYRGIHDRKLKFFIKVPIYKGNVPNSSSYLLADHTGKRKLKK